MSRVKILIRTLSQYGGILTTNNVLSAGLVDSSSLTLCFLKYSTWWDVQLSSNFIRKVRKPANSDAIMKIMLYHRKPTKWNCTTESPRNYRVCLRWTILVANSNNKKKYFVNFLLAFTNDSSKALKIKINNDK